MIIFALSSSITAFGNPELSVCVKLFLFQWGTHASQSLKCSSGNSESFQADKGCCNIVHGCKSVKINLL